MINLKTYIILLQENCNFLEMSVKIKRNNSKLDYDDKTKKDLSITFGKGKFAPCISKSKQRMGYPVYSVYEYKDTLKTLKVLKNRNNVKMNNKQYDQFLNRTAVYLQDKIIPKNTDLIITPRFSSFILDDLIDNLEVRLPHIKLIKSGFEKYNIEDLNLHYDNYNIPTPIKERMKKILDRAKEAGYLQIKNIPIPYTKFVKKFLKSNLKPTYIEGKNIVVLDDKMTSGFTFKGAFEHLLTYSPETITGISLFKCV